MYIEKDIIDQIRESAQIEDIVKRYVPTLQKRGKNWIALCPFHKEKTPSFTVTPDKQIYYCFGCKASGNVFNFVSRIEGLSFPESVKRVAEIIGMDIPDSGNFFQESGKTSEMFRYTRYAANLYHKYLQSENGAKARNYLQKRKITDEMIDTFKLGYAPESWDFLLTGLRKKNADQDTAFTCGLISKKDGDRDTRYFDRFRNRIIFPIFDPQDRPVGFGGRIIDSGEPKYLNSPETPIFKKRNILYGLNLAKDAIAYAERAIIVEGYLDVIACYQNGIRNVVAPLGTSITEEHFRVLSRYCNQAVLLLDSDEAGKSAALRTSELSIRSDFNVRVARLPFGDPFDFLDEKSGKELMIIIDSAIGAIDFQLSEIIKKDTGENRVTLLKNLFSVIKTISYETERAYFLKKLSEKLSCDESHLRSDFKSYIQNEKPDDKKSFLLDNGPQGDFSKNDYFNLLRLLLQYPHLVDKAIIDFPSSEANDKAVSNILSVLYKIKKETGDISVNKLFDIFNSGQEMEILNKCVGSVAEFSEPDNAYTDIYITMKLHSIDARIDNYVRLIKQSPQTHHQYLAEIEILRREKEKLSNYMYNK